MAERIQLRRVRGWRMPPNTVSVTRPGKWGNMYRIEQRDDYEGLWLVVRGDIVQDHAPTKTAAASLAVSLFREALLKGEFDLHVEDVRRELRGKNLACWCRVGSPCHGDALLRIANEVEGG